MKSKTVKSQKTENKQMKKNKVSKEREECRVKKRGYGGEAVWTE